MRETRGSGGVKRRKGSGRGVAGWEIIQKERKDSSVVDISDISMYVLTVRVYFPCQYHESIPIIGG